MSLRSDRSSGAGASRAPKRVFAQSSLSPDAAHFSSMKGQPQAFPPVKREVSELSSGRRHSQPGLYIEPRAATGINVQHPPPYQRSQFFSQERQKPVTDEIREAYGDSKPKFTPPSLERLREQEGPRPQKEKQFSPGSGKSNPSHASTYRPYKRGRPGLISHQVTSQTKPSQKAEPTHKHPGPSFSASARSGDRIHRPDQSSPILLADLDHSMKGSPLLFTHQPSGSIGEQANRPMIQESVVDPRSTAPLRPNSRESNISKRRVNSSRVSFPFHGDEMADLEHFGSAWNHYLQNHARRSENVAARMTELEKTLEEKANTVKQHTLKCNRQAEVIASLENQVTELTAQKQQLTEENQGTKKQLERNVTKREEMQSKIRSYREKLNEAIAEQQDLYTRSKTLCDTAIDDVRKTQEQAEASHRAAAEMVAEGARKAAGARREMKTLLEGELKECQILRNKGKHLPCPGNDNSSELFQPRRKTQI